MAHKKPLVGILTNLAVAEEGMCSGSERVFVCRDYINGVILAGGIPIMLPLVKDLEIMYKQIDAVDCLIATGGQDVHPSHYQEVASELLGTVSHERDFYEMAAIRYAYTLKKPILGICRGLQLINVCFGGSLYQDIPHSFPSSPLKHVQEVHQGEASHIINLTENSILASLMKSKQLFINSFHHQSVKNLAPGFIVNARAEDGIIEGIEKTDSPFLMGVQWHPERMLEKHPIMIRLFEALIAQTNTYGSP